jgi:O-antigen ligase
MAVSWAEKRTTSLRLDGLFWPLLAGVSVGLLFVSATQLPTKWFFFVLLGSLIGIVSLAPIDRKAYYLRLLVLALPLEVDLNLLFHPSSIYRSTYGFLILLNYIPLAALYLIWFLRCIAGKLPLQVSTRGLVSLCGLFVSGCVSVSLGNDWLFGAFDLFSLAMSILVFLYTASEIRAPRELRLVLVALMMTVALEGTIALGQYATGSTLGLDFFGASWKYSAAPGLATLTRVSGTLGHPNSLALFFDLLLPLGFSLLFCPMPRLPWYLLLATVTLGTAGLVTSLSRGGMTAVGLAVAIILLVHWRKRVGLIQGSIILGTAALFVISLILTTQNPIQERFFQQDYGSAYGRVPHMRVALRILRDRPLFGVGMNRYTAAAQYYDHTPERIITAWEGPVHNLFLFIAGEIGLVGLAFFLLLLGTVIRSLLPALRSSDPLIASTGLGLLMGLLAYSAHTQIDYSHWTHWSILWFLLGLAIGVGRLTSSTAPPQPEKS